MAFLQSKILLTLTAAVLPLVVATSLAQNEPGISSSFTSAWWNTSHAFKFSTHLTSLALSKVTDIIKWNQTSLTSVIKTTRDKMSSWIEYKIAIFLNDYFVYITSIPGVITNTLIIYLTTVIKHRSTTELYMLILGVTDFIVVSFRITFKTMMFLNYTFRDVDCRIIYFFTNVAYIFSNWILVVWTIERSVAVLFPLKLSTLSTSRVILVTLAIQLLSITCISVPQIMEISSVLSSTGKYGCVHSTFYHKTYAMIENCVYIYIPMLIIVTGNVSIIFKMRYLAKSRLAITSSEETLKRRTRERKQMTRILILIACTFVVLHFFQILAKIWESIYPNSSKIWANNFRKYVQFFVFKSLGYQITDFQNSLNFFLYCAFGSKVQKALLAVVCKKRRGNSPFSTKIVNKSVSSMM